MYNSRKMPEQAAGTEAIYRSGLFRDSMIMATLALFEASSNACGELIRARLLRTAFYAKLVSSDRINFVYL